MKIKERIEELTTLCFIDSYKEDLGEEDIKKRIKPLKDNRVYGIKFFHSMNNNADQGEANCYIIAVTRNYLFQFTGPGLKSFKQIFNRYNRNPSLFNDSCKHFPEGFKKNSKVEFDILYKNNKEKKLDILSQLGWRTDSGYCWSEFNYEIAYKNGDLPLDLKTFRFKKIYCYSFSENNRKRRKKNEIKSNFSNSHS